MSDITKIRNQYDDICQRVKKNEVKNIKLREIKALLNDVSQQIDTVTKQEKFEHLEELVAYQQKLVSAREEYVRAVEMKKKYKEVTQIFQKIFKGQIARNPLNTQVKENMTEKPIKITQSFMRPEQPNKQSITSPQINIETTIQQFFTKNRPSNSPSFKDILCDKPVNKRNARRTPRKNNHKNIAKPDILQKQHRTPNYKETELQDKIKEHKTKMRGNDKKIEVLEDILRENNDQIHGNSNSDKLNSSFRRKQELFKAKLEEYERENKLLKRKICELCPDYNREESPGSMLSKISDRILFLQNQNSKLSKQNTKLKSWAELSHNTPTYSMLSVQQILKTPHIFQTLSNDLQKIHSKFQSDGLTSYDPRSIDLQLPKKAMKSSFLSQIKAKPSNQLINSFSFFEMSRSNFSDCGIDPHDPYRLGLENKITVRKNKLAFFKQAGVLVRDQYVDIAYKRYTQHLLTDNLIKLNLYINDKAGHPQQINIEYEYEINYLEIKRNRRLIKIQRFSQGLESIEVRLKPQVNNVNTHMTATIEIDGRKYKIWVPILFVVFTNFPMTIDQTHHHLQMKIIRPHNAFNGPESAQVGIPNLSIQGNEGKMWVRSKDQEGPLFLKWKNGNMVEISTIKVWIDAISFIFLEYN